MANRLISWTFFYSNVATMVTGCLWHHRSACGSNSITLIVFFCTFFNQLKWSEQRAESRRKKEWPGLWKLHGWSQFLFILVNLCLTCLNWHWTLYPFHVLITRDYICLSVRLVIDWETDRQTDRHQKMTIFGGYKILIYFVLSNSLFLFLSLSLSLSNTFSKFRRTIFLFMTNEMWFLKLLPPSSSAPHQLKANEREKERKKEREKEKKKKL